MRTLSNTTIASAGLFFLLNASNVLAKTSASPLVAARGKQSTELAKPLHRRQDFPTGSSSISYCRFFDHSSVKVGNRIIIEGGAFTDTEDNIYLNDGYISIDFSSKFSLPLKSKSDNVNSDLKYPEGYPLTWLGALWSDGESKVYKYGGFFPDNYSYPTEYVNVQSNTLYEVDLDEGTFNKLDVPSDLTRAANGGYFDVPEINTGFWMGGFISNNTDVEYEDWPWPNEFMVLDSLLTFDTKENTWKNSTTGFDPRSAGELVHISSDEGSGYLVSIGGFEGPKGRMSSSATNADYKLVPLDEIHLYDIDKEKWYSQKATGDIPPLRQLGCVVLAVASDRSSLNIVLHGGANWGNTEAYSDTYVLSLPSFQWVKIDSSGSDIRRMTHTCHLMGDNQMAVIGGRDVDQYTYLLQGASWNATVQGACDSKGFVNILNLNTFDWENTFDPEYTGYEVHDDIVEKIGGTFEGGATALEPLDGWDDEALGDIFSSLVVASPVDAPKPKPSPKKSNGPGLGVIIGASVGGVVVLCLIAGLIWYFCRRKPTSSPEAAGQQPPVTQLPPPNQPAPYMGQQNQYENSHGGYYQPVYPASPLQSPQLGPAGAAYPSGTKAEYNPYAQTPPNPAPGYSPFPHMAPYSTGQPSHNTAPPQGIHEVHGNEQYIQQQPSPQQQSPGLGGYPGPPAPQQQPEATVYSELPETGSNNRK